MPVGAIGQGIASTFADYIGQERARNRAAEDNQINEHMSLIKALSERPDANPALLGKALHDLVDLQSAKGGKGKMKGGMEGFMGSHELPMSQFLQGIQDGTTPISGRTTENVPHVSGGMGMIGPRPSGIDLPGMEHINAPQMPQAPMPEVPKVGFTPQPVAHQPLLRDPMEMAEEKGRIATSLKDTEVQGTIDRIKRYVTDPGQQEQATNAALGVPSGFLGTSTQLFKDPATGETFRGVPLKQGGIWNSTSGMVVPGAEPLYGAALSSRAPTVVEMAAKELFNKSPRDLNPQESGQLREFVNSVAFEQFAKRTNFSSEVTLARAWASPHTITGTDPTSGQAISTVMSGDQVTGGSHGAVSLPVPPPIRPNGPVGAGAVGTGGASGAARPPVGARGAVGATGVTGTGVTGKPAGGLAVAPGGGIVAAPGMDLRNQAAALAALPTIIKDIGTMALRLNRTPNVAGKVIGAGKRMAGAMGMYDPAAEYKSAQDSFIATLARFSGEKGVLTDPDVQRAAHMLPQIGNSPKLTAAKIDRVMRFLEAKMKGLPDPFEKAPELVDDGGMQQSASPTATTTPALPAAPLRKPIPSSPGQFAISTDGGRTWKAEP